MRKLILSVTAALAWVATASATAPLSVTIATLALTRPAQAGTAVLPGWQVSCGRNPRCFEQREARRQRAKLRRQLDKI
jgi:hypothetical protein